MAEFNPNIVRAVATEVQEDTLSFYVALLPLLATVRSWVLHCTNANLPDPYTVKLAVEQYQALKNQLKTLELRTWIAEVKTAAAEDGFEYTPPCTGTAGGLNIPDWGIRFPDTGLIIYS
jgi:hypothetical protein